MIGRTDARLIGDNPDAAFFDSRRDAPAEGRGRAAFGLQTTTAIGR